MIIAGGTIFPSEEGTQHQANAFPAVCVLPGGRWLAGCRAAPLKSESEGQHAVMSWSDDEGATWSPPVDPFRPANVDGRPGLHRYVGFTSLGGTRVMASIIWVDNSRPGIPFFNEETEGLLDTRTFLSLSEDSGETWSTPWLQDTSPFLMPAPLTGPILKLADGRLACQFELNKTYEDTSPWVHHSVMMFSSDEGKSWPESAITSADPENRIFYWDQRAAVLSDGTLLNLFWTFDTKAAVYLNIHAKESLDSGRTWSEFWDTGVREQPAPAVSLPGGEIAMVYVDRSAAPAIKLRVSSDRGRTWPEKTEEVIYATDLTGQIWKKADMQDAWAEMGKYATGLPTTAALPGGDILVLYYAGPDSDHISIHWARVHPSANAA